MCLLHKTSLQISSEGTSMVFGGSLTLASMCFLFPIDISMRQLHVHFGYIILECGQIQRLFIKFCKSYTQIDCSLRIKSKKPNHTILSKAFIKKRAVRFFSIHFSMNKIIYIVNPLMNRNYFFCQILDVKSVSSFKYGENVTFLQVLFSNIHVLYTNALPKLSKQLFLN